MERLEAAKEERRGWCITSSNLISVVICPDTGLKQMTIRLLPYYYSSAYVTYLGVAAACDKHPAA
jgi:hypothetical protein